MYQFHITQMHESTKIILRLFFFRYLKQMKILISFIFKNIIDKFKKMNFSLILIISLIVLAIEIKANRVRINLVFS